MAIQGFEDSRRIFPAARGLEGVSSGHVFERAAFCFGHVRKVFYLRLECHVLSDDG
jgi:hypothetical protein